MHRYGLGLLRLYGLSVTARGPYVERPGRPLPRARRRGSRAALRDEPPLDARHLRRPRLPRGQHREPGRPLALAGHRPRRPPRGHALRRPPEQAERRRGDQRHVPRDRARARRDGLPRGDHLRRRRGAPLPPGRLPRRGAHRRRDRAGGHRLRGRGRVVPSTSRSSSHLLRVSSTPELRIGLEIGEPVRGDAGDVEAIKALAHERVQALVLRARARLERG